MVRNREQVPLVERTPSLLGSKNPLCHLGLEKCPMSDRRKIDLVLCASADVNRLANGDLLRGYGTTDELYDQRN